MSRTLRRLAPTVLLGALLAGALAGCSDSAPPSPGEGAGDQSDEITVLAASSLTESFTELARAFQSRHPDATVRLSFDSSATLAEQVAQGAPADVLATADERTMQVVVDAGSSAGQPQVFATNRLTVVVPSDNPAGVKQFKDIDESGLDYVMCVVSAPCGALAQVVLDEQGITNPPASEEVDVRAVLSKVQLGEADAGLVYETDARTAGDTVRTLSIPGSADTVTRYPVVALSDAANPDLAADWVDLTTSAEGQRILRAAGFGAP